MTWLWVALGGAVGALLRQGLVLALTPLATRAEFPLPVLLINVSGSFALGLTLALVGRGVWPEAVRLGFGTGVLGAFTTFSTFSTELDGLLRQGQSGKALLYALLSVGLSVVAALGGRVLGERL